MTSEWFRSRWRFKFHNESLPTTTIASHVLSLSTSFSSLEIILHLYWKLATLVNFFFMTSIFLYVNKLWSYHHSYTVTTLVFPTYHLTNNKKSKINGTGAWRSVNGVDFILKVVWAECWATVKKKGGAWAERGADSGWAETEWWAAFFATPVNIPDNQTWDLSP